ncbi:hypothetical protein G7046_g6792 [Stylonectria norvegica]|nr:hypothetical protein G7046_g6792 [Stylonectria norvegica]
MAWRSTTQGTVSPITSHPYITYTYVHLAEALEASSSSLSQTGQAGSSQRELRGSQHRSRTSSMSWLACWQRRPYNYFARLPRSAADRLRNQHAALGVNAARGVNAALGVNAKDVPCVFQAYVRNGRDRVGVAGVAG